MANGKRKLIVEIAGNARGLTQAVGEADRSLRTMAAGVGAAAAKVAAFGAAVGAAAGVVGFRLANAASDLNEAISKTNVIFGDSSAKVVEWSKATATALGMSQVQALDAASTFATFGRSAGMSGDQLVMFAGQFSALAADLASFNNTTPQEAIDAIGAALRGEAEPMRRYGVLLDDATLRQRALALGIVSTTKDALTPQQKVLAAQAEILAQTGAAQGDFARTSGGFANQQRILAAQFANVRMQVGQMLLPAFSRMAWVLNTSVIPAITRLVDAFKVGGIAGVFKQLWDDIKKSSLGDLARWIEDAFAWVLKNKDLVLSVLGAIGVVLAKVFAGKLIGQITAMVKAVMPFVPTILRFAGVIGILAGVAYGFVTLYRRSETFRRIVEPVVAIFRTLRDVAMEVWAAFKEDGLGGAIKQLGKSLSDAWPSIWENLKEFGGRIVEFLVDEAWPAVRDTAVRLSLALWEWVKDAVPAALRQLGEWAKALGEWFTGTALPWLGRTARDLSLALWEWIKDAVPAALRQLGEWLRQLGGWFTGTALPWLGRKASELAQKLMGFLAEATATLPEKLGEWLGAFAAWVVTTGVPTVMRETTQFIAAITSWVVDAAKVLIVEAAQFSAAAIGWIGDAVKEMPFRLWDLATAITSWIKGDGLRLIGGAFDVLSNVITAPFRFAFNAIARFWNDSVGKLSFRAPDWVPGIGGKGWDVPDIPLLGSGGNTSRPGGFAALAAGGIVTRPTLALIGEGGESEAVVPLSRAGEFGFGGGRTVNVTVNMPPGSDGADVVRRIRAYERIESNRWRTGQRVVPGVA